MSKDISTIKCKNEVNLKGFSLNPQFLQRTKITFERIKGDAGAVYITIRTTGGMLAMFRYAYEGDALKDIKKDSETEGYTVKTAADTVKVVLGNYKHNDNTEKGTEALMDDIFSVLQTSAYQMTPHTADGFMLLIHNSRRNTGGPKAPEKNEDYNEDIMIECFNIREKDEPVIALISAINLWGNRVGCSFNTYYYRDYERIEPSTARELYSNSGIMSIFDRMREMQMTYQAIDDAAMHLSGMFKPKDARVPSWVAIGDPKPKKKGRIEPYDDDDFWDD